MKIFENISLLPYNTFGIDAKADFLIEYDSVDDLIGVLQHEVMHTNKYFHIGSGSNLLFLSDFKGVILHSAIHSVELVSEDDEFVFVKVGAGVVFDDFVAHCVEMGWGGVENLSLIPGETGASAVQNIGAYGVEIQDVVDSVYTVEIAGLLERVFSNPECSYGYRSSVFKTDLKGEYIVTHVVFKLRKSPEFNLSYHHLKEDVLKSGPLNLRNIRHTIIRTRESKLPDTKVLGNAGSFFMNPVVDKELFLSLQSRYPEMPHYYVSDVEEKIPAGWLIEKCGLKGFRLGNAGVHEKQALVLVNFGGATGNEIVALAEKIQQTVSAEFGIQLQAEVNYIN